MKGEERRHHLFAVFGLFVCKGGMEQNGAANSVIWLRKKKCNG